MRISGVTGDYFYVAVREGSYARIVGNMSELGWERDIFLSRGQEGELPACLSAAGGKVTVAPIPSSP